MPDDWTDIKKRLEDAVSGVTSDEHWVEVQPDDLRAALWRMEQLERDVWSLRGRLFGPYPPPSGYGFAR